MKVLSLKDSEVKGSIELDFNDSIPLLNYYLLDFYGKADGTTLTRNYLLSKIQNMYMRFIKMYIHYYNDNTNQWIREAAYDNKTFASSANNRFSLLRGFTKIDSYYFSQFNNSAGTGIINLLVNGNQLNIFPSANLPAIDELDLNILLGYTIQSGIDFQLNYNFYQDIDSNTSNNPYCHVLLLVQTFQNDPTQKIIQSNVSG